MGKSTKDVSSESIVVSFGQAFKHGSDKSSLAEPANDDVFNPHIVQNWQGQKCARLPECDERILRAYNCMSLGLQKKNAGSHSLPRLGPAPCNETDAVAPCPSSRGFSRRRKA